MYWLNGWFWPLYFLAGAIYWFVNCFVRKLEDRDKWLLPLMWFFGWPGFIVLLLIEKYLLPVYSGFIRPFFKSIYDAFINYFRTRM